MLTTHYIEEAEQLCDEVAVAHHGRVIVRGRPAELVRRHVARLGAVQASWVSQPVTPSTAVAVLGAERIDGATFAGRRRAATLEDVFVVLTGEELA